VVLCNRPRTAWPTFTSTGPGCHRSEPQDWPHEGTRESRVLAAEPTDIRVGAFMLLSRCSPGRRVAAHRGFFLGDQEGRSPSLITAFPKFCRRSRRGSGGRRSQYTGTIEIAGDPLQGPSRWAVLQPAGFFPLGQGFFSSATGNVQRTRPLRWELFLAPQGMRGHGPHPASTARRTATGIRVAGAADRGFRRRRRGLRSLLAANSP